MELKKLWALEAKGMTLIEILAALVILSVAILPLLSSISDLNRFGALQRQRNHAASQAVSTLEGLKKAYLGQFPQTTYPPLGEYILPLPPDDRGTTYVARVVYSPGERRATYYENHTFVVAVTVYWPDLASSNRLQLSTMLSSR